MKSANTRSSRADAIAGCLLGKAVGDALGLPCEGLTPQRQRRLFPNLDGYRLLPGGRGLVSDDTEHTCLIAQSLIVSAGEAALFEKRFARELRLWLLLLPAGVGLATLRATLRLLVGVPPARSGVFSAGNGPAYAPPCSASASATTRGGCVNWSGPARASRTRTRRLSGARSPSRLRPTR